LAAKKHARLGPATLNLSLFHGGLGINVVPDKCRIGLDIRTHPQCPADWILPRVRAVCDRQKPRARLTVHNDFTSFETPRTEPWAAALRKSAARGWDVAPWFCDANVFGAAGIPSVAFGPGNIAQAHTRDEYIKAAELEAGVAAFSNFLSSAQPLARSKTLAL
jgi:acetylornithine deacetylase/succinyl-diaminopimelate desuccinylase-like protein